MLRKLILLCFVIGYGCLFIAQERYSQYAQIELSFPIPVTVEKTVLGYLRQLGGELHFIKSAVYIGGLSARRKQISGIDRLAANLDSASELNPPFIDTYYYCESFIASQGHEYVLKANAILNKGIVALPDNWILPFFLGFNHFYYLNEEAEAAEVLISASKKSEAPSWLGHLASVLAAKGGNIRTGLSWLKAMHKGEKNDSVRKGYENDIADYEMALKVQDGVDEFRRRYGTEPMTLDQLVPEILSQLPEFKGNYVLKWDRPVLRLERPSRRKSQ